MDSGVCNAKDKRSAHMKKKKSDMEELNAQKIKSMEKEEKSLQKADKVSLGIEHRNIMIGVTAFLSLAIVIGGVFMVKKLADDGKYGNINDTSSALGEADDRESFSPSLGDGTQADADGGGRHGDTAGEHVPATTAPAAVVDNNGIISDGNNDEQRITADIFTIGVQDDEAPITAQTGAESARTDKTPDSQPTEDGAAEDVPKPTEEAPKTSRTPQTTTSGGHDNTPPYSTSADDDYPPYPDDVPYTYPSYSFEFDTEEMYIPDVEIDPSDFLS